MKLSIDHDNNVAYLMLGPERPSVRQVALDDGNLVVDFDETGAVLGFEFLNARTQLTTEWDNSLLDEAPAWGVWDIESGNALDFLATEAEAEKVAAEIRKMNPGKDDDIIVVGPTPTKADDDKAA